MFKNISAVLFDIDGTLLDTSEYIIQAFEHTLAQEGFGEVAQDRNAIIATIGTPLKESYEKLVGDHPDAIERMIAARYKFQNDRLDLVTPFPKVHETLQKLEDAGMRIGACTNRSKNTMLNTLEYTNLRDYFEVIVCPEDTLHHKPHPEPIEKALDELRIPKTRAVIVGDSEVDIASGKNADIGTIRVTYGIHTHHLHNPEPDAFIDSIEALLPLLL